MKTPDVKLDHPTRSMLVHFPGCELHGKVLTIRISNPIILQKEGEDDWVVVTPGTLRVIDGKKCCHVGVLTPAFAQPTTTEILMTYYALDPDSQEKIILSEEKN